MSKGQLILHIGNCKTGTTALQHFFTRNRDAMLAAGLYYPRTGTEYFSYNHWSLMYEYIADYSQVWPVPADYQRHPRGFAGLFADLQQEIDPQLAAGNDVLLSCEGLFFDNRNQQDISRLLQWFAPYRPRIILYLRRQDEMLDSMINELVKNGDIVYQRDMVEAFAEQLIIPYHERLQWWAESLDREQIQVIAYHKSSYHPEHTLFHQFLSAIGHPYRDHYRQPKGEKNSALRSLPGFLVMNTINHVSATARQKSRLVPAIQAWEAEQQLPRYSILDQPLWQFVRERAEVQNSALARDYLQGDEQLAFPALPATALTREPVAQQATLEQLDSFCRYLARQQPEQLHWLAALIAATPESEAYGEQLGPLRILCQRALPAPPATRSHTADSERQNDRQSDHDNDSADLQRQLQRANSELARALQVLEQYHQALQQRPVVDAQQPDGHGPSATDFYQSRLYRYIARPVWKLTGGLRRLSGLARRTAQTGRNSADS